MATASRPEAAVEASERQLQVIDAGGPSAAISGEAHDD
jgi:hypothetical protein